MERPDGWSRDDRWRSFLLGRLSRFTRLAGDSGGLPQAQLQLARHAMFAAYLDCAGLGLTVEADEIVAGGTWPESR